MIYIDFNDVIFYNLYVGKGQDSKILWSLIWFSDNFEEPTKELEFVHEDHLPKDSKEILQRHLNLNTLHTNWL